MKSPASAAVKRAKAPRWPTVVLFHVNRRETLRFRIADDKGRPIKGMQKRMNTFLRCHLTNQQHAMNPRLLRLIYETGRITRASASRWSRATATPRSRRTRAART